MELEVQDPLREATLLCRAQGKAELAKWLLSKDFEDAVVKAAKEE